MSDNAEDKQQKNDNPALGEQQRKDNSPDKEQKNSIADDGEQQKQLKKHKKKSRHNKIYRTPESPSQTELLIKEKSFVLDCNATSSISRDYSFTNPKLGPVIPPYNSQRDKHVNNYFRFSGVERTLKKVGQYDKKATSIEGPVSDSFYLRGSGYKYLSLRNKFGAGHSQETIDGHAKFMNGIKGVSGYNGKYGFRRNTPWLRQTPTPFGTTLLFPIN